MAYESSVRAGSGISVIHDSQIPNMRGTNAVVLNYEDIVSCIGIMQCSGLIVGTNAIHASGPATRLRGRRKLRIQNLGPARAFIGGTSGVTINSGWRLAAPTELGGPNSGSGFADIEFDILDHGDVWVISDSVAALRVLEMK